MSYITVDLKVIEVLAPSVSRSTCRPIQEILGGLVLLWHRCWSLKTETVTLTGLTGCFGPTGIDFLIKCLEDAEFLSLLHDNCWVVKGADKYLRLTEGRKKGGKNASSNLLQGKKRPGENLRLGPGSLPADSRLTEECLPADSRAFTEHRTPNTFKEGSVTIPDGSLNTLSDTQFELISPKLVKKKSNEARSRTPAESFEIFLSGLSPNEARVFEAFDSAFGIQVAAADYAIQKFIAGKLKIHPVEDLVDAIHGYVRDSFRKKNSNIRAIFKDALTITTLASEYRKAINS